MKSRDPIAVVSETPGLKDKSYYEYLLTSDDKIKQAEANHGLAIHAVESGKYSEAYEYSVRACDLCQQWNYLNLLAQLSLLLSQEANKMREQAVNAARDATLMGPNKVQSWIVNGNVNLATNNYEQAIAAFSRALELVKEGSFEEARIQAGLGHAYDKTMQKRLAIEHYRNSLSIDPSDKHTNYLLATRFIDDTFDPEALRDHSERAIGGPDGDLAIWNSALGNLSTGRWERGWEQHEIRKIVPEFNAKITTQNRFPDKPEWTGQTHIVDEKTNELRKAKVLIIREQGQGDSLQFVRYLNLIKDCEVLMECNTNMGQLFEYNFPNVSFVPMLENPTNVPEFDYHQMLMSLPYITREYTYWDGAYLIAEPDYINKWSGIRGKKPAIGVCWSGERRNHDARCFQIDRQRSMTWDTFKPIVEANPQIDFVSLQLGRPLDQYKEDVPLILPQGIEHWSDTAGIMHALDGVITVDTSVAHLAGGMGKKTWLLDRYAHCWRWPYKLDDNGFTAWYPTMKIIRQTEYMDWKPVIERMIGELRTIGT